MLYVIGANPLGPLKIGISLNPEGRLKQLQTGHPEKLHLFATGTASFTCGYTKEPVRDSTAERFIHSYLGDRRQVGEWFDICIGQILDGSLHGAEMQHCREVGDFEPSWELTPVGEAAYEIANEDEDREWDERPAKPLRKLK